MVLPSFVTGRTDSRGVAGASMIFERTWDAASCSPWASRSSVFPNITIRMLKPDLGQLRKIPSFFDFAQDSPVTLENVERRRVRARISSHVWVLKHLSGKARGLRILLVRKGRATPPDGMDRRPHRGSYFCANPKVTTTFCISPYTPISYTAVLRPTAVSRFTCHERSGKG